MKEKGQKLKICAKKARAANKRSVAFLAKIATRWIYFIHIFRQLLVPNLSKSEQKNSVLALGAYYTDYILAGTRLTLKTGVKTLEGRISFQPQSLPGKIIITYLIRVFDTTWESKFWALKFLFLGQFSIFSY